MSSVCRAPSQVSAPTKYFVASGLVEGFLPSALTVALNDNSKVLSNTGSVINTNDAAGFVNDITTTGNTSARAAGQFRDMGKTLTVQEKYRNVYVYRLVQRVDGAGNEGVGGKSLPFWGLVWADDGATTLTRTG